MVNLTAYKNITQTLSAHNATLVAVSKVRSAGEIMQLYAEGQRDFGENYVQELLEKQEMLPKDIRWHFIGHLQSNKVKYIAPFIYLIHGVDKESLLKEINKQANKLSINIKCLLQLHIAKESSKFGFDDAEISQIEEKDYPSVTIEGMMGMATFTDDREQVKKEFTHLHQMYVELSSKFSSFKTLSMGMSDDYEMALECGSNMVRIGSKLFGAR